MREGHCTLHRYARALYAVGEKEQEIGGKEREVECAVIQIDLTLLPSCLHLPSSPYPHT
jgi:hypothetical protein